MGFIEELKWRGMLHDCTPELEEVLKKGMAVGYIGFDPTAPSLTIGNYVQVMLLTLFQKYGHKPIVLMGGATGRIGDPSGKDKERDLKTFDELDSNLEYQKKIFEKLINFQDGENKAVLVNNLDFYKNMSAIDFLRVVGKTLTVNYMMNKESVKRRIETGISFTEFSYQLLQGYDFQKLNEEHDCIIQMGGSDQWGNITTGVEFVRRNLAKKVHAVTTPLLTKADGSKFGKSEKGNIWIDETYTSPYQFFQFWINADDRDLPKFIRYFTLKEKEEVEALEAEYEGNPRGLKEVLAEELTIRIHGVEAYESAKKVSELLFNKKAKREMLLSLDAKALAMVANEIPTFKVSKSIFEGGVNILDLLAEHTQMTTSKGEARRAIKGRAIAVNKTKIESHETTIEAEEILHNQYIMVENGKKNKFMIVIAD